MSDSDVKVGDKIKVVCHGCGARYRVSSEKVKGRRFRATCKRCGGIIVARCTSAFTVLPEEGSYTTDSITVEKSKVDMQTAREQEQAWYAVIDQKPHGPLSTEQLRQYFAAGQVGARTYLWRSGDPEWRRMQEVPEFSDLTAEEPTTAYNLDDAPTEDLGAVSWPKGDGEADEVDGDPTSADTRVLDTGTAANTDEAFGEATPTDEPTNYRYPAPLGQAAPAAYDTDHGPVSKLPSKPTLMGWDAPEFLQDEPRAQAPQQAAPPVPRVEPRKAWLPAPTGIPRHLTGGIHQPVDNNGSMADPGPLFTRPMSRSERAAPDQNVGAPPATGTDKSAVSLSSLAPANPQVPDNEIPLITPGPILELPSQEGRSATARVQPAAAQLPPPSPALADAHRISKTGGSGFWTTGKIAVAAAGGGGLAVAMAVIFGVYLARSGSGRMATPEEALALNKTPKAATPSKKPPPAKTKAAPAPKKVAATDKPAPTPAPAPVDADEPGAPVKPPAPAPEKASPPEKTPPERKAAVAKSTSKPKAKSRKRRSTRKRKPSTRRRRRSSSADVDALLMGSSNRRRRPSTRRRSSSDSSADDILAAGNTRKRRPSSRRRSSSNSSADDILAAGNTRRRRPSSRPPRSNLPKHPSKAQVQSTMRRAMGRVGSCYEKYQQRGIIKVSMRVRPDGSADGRVVGSFAGTATAFCVLAGVNKLRFPKFSGAAFSFVYPYRLK